MVWAPLTVGSTLAVTVPLVVKTLITAEMVVLIVVVVVSAAATTGESTKAITAIVKTYPRRSFSRLKRIDR
jgi:hypothetical protein